MHRLISSQEFIGRTMADLNLQGTDFLDTIYQWIEDGIEFMDIPKYYVLKVERKEIKEGRVRIPAEWNYIKAVLTTNNFCVDENYKIKEYIQNLRRLVIRNNSMINDTIKLGIVENSFGTMNGNYLYTTFDKGNVLFLYKGLPTDCDGYPMVPKNARVNEALRFWIIYNLSLKGFDHPKVSWDVALQRWNQMYPAAGNDVSWPDAQDYQEFTEMWTNQLLGDISNTLEL